MPISRALRPLLLLGALALCGCPADEQAPLAAAPSEAAPAAGAIKVKTGAGEVSHRIKPADGGFKVKDKDKQERFRLRLDDDTCKVKDPKDVVVAYIGASESGYKIKDPKSKAVLYKFHSTADGDYKLETPDDALVAKVQKKDYGWKIEDGQGTELYKSKTKDGKTSLKDPSDQALYYTKDPVSDLAFAALALPKLSDAQRVGLMMLVQRKGK